MNARPPSRRFNPSPWVERLVPAALVLLLLGLIAVIVLVAVAVVK